MKQKKVVFLIFLFLFSSLATAFSNDFLSATSTTKVSTDFEKVIIDDTEIYTESRLKDSSYFIGIDQLFYGSNQGEVTIRVYYASETPKDIRIGFETKNGKIIEAKRLSDKTLSLASNKSSYIDSITVNSTNTVNYIDYLVTFNPSEIGLQEGFDVVFYDSFGVELERIDPFLSGYSYREKLTLDTSQLDANVTNDHSILVYLGPTDTNFWTGDTLGTGNGITFTGSDGETEFDYNGTFNNSDNNAWFWVNYTDVFDAVNDSEMYIYYGGADVDNSDGTSAFPANYTAVYHLDEPSGTLGADDTGSYDLTHNNTPTIGLGGEIDLGVGYTAASSENSTNGTLLDGGASKVSFSVWVKQTATWDAGATTNEPIIFKQNTAGDKDLLLSQWRNDGTIIWRFIDGSGTTFEGFTSKASWTANTWYNLTYVFDADNDFMRIYVNGDITDGNILSTPIGDMAAGTTTSFELGSYSSQANYSSTRLDEVKVFDGVALTADEALLLYLSESDTLINFGEQEEDISASFSSSGTTWLDPENGITSRTYVFTNNSKPVDANFTWFVNDVNQGNDVNLSHAFTSVNDYNVFLQMDSEGTLYTDQETISIINVVQGVDINYSLNDFAVTDANVNFGVTYTGTGTSFNWGFDDGNVATRNAQTTFTTSGEKNVCVTITNSGSNKTTCENFYVGRVLVRIPKDAESFVNLSPFEITVSDYPAQNYSGLTVDTNIFVFNPTTNFSPTLTVDYNSDYYSTSRRITFNSYFHDYQAYLIANDGTNLEATVYTINNPEGRVSISGMFIESYTDINSVSTLVESKTSDGTGQAIFHFVKNQEYILKFYDSDGDLLMTKTIEAVNTTYFAYLDLGTVSTTPTPSIEVGVNWYPVSGSVVPIDQNASFSVILTPTNGTIGDVNIWITHQSDTNILFNQVYAVNSSEDYNVSFDLNVAGFDDDYPLKVNVQIFDSNSQQVGATRIKNFSFKDTGFILATERAKEALGQFGVTLIALILTVIAIGFLTSQGIGEDMNFVVIPAILITLLFAFIGWIEWDVWASGVFFGVGLAMWGVRK